LWEGNTISNTSRYKLKRKIDAAKGRVVEFSAPADLYISDDQAVAFERATTENNEYQTSLDQPILDMVSEISSEVSSNISGPLHFVDLGPGFPSKSLVLIDKLISDKHRLQYFAVDVSQFFLDRAIGAVQNRNITTAGFKVSFDKLAPRLDRRLLLEQATRICFLGLTYNNFPLDEINPILADITNEGDILVICFQTSENQTNEDLVRPYKSNAVDNFCFLPLSHLGFKRKDFEFEVRFRENGIRVGYEAIHDIKNEDVNIEKGTIIETSCSFRFEREIVEQSISEWFEFTSERHSENGMFVVALKRKGG